VNGVGIMVEGKYGELLKVTDIIINELDILHSPHPGTHENHMLR
jgi:hypothetical protein